jgi:hypothetical protein
MEINAANIANALHSVATEHVVAVANDIYDKDMERYQSKINEMVDNASDILGMNYDFEGNVYYGTNSNATLNEQRHVTMSVAGSYNITTTASSHIYFFIPSSVTSFHAMINGLEIPFTVTSVTVGGVNYKKYESTNTYDQGTFNIIVS